MGITFAYPLFPFIVTCTRPSIDPLGSSSCDNTSPKAGIESFPTRSIGSKPLWLRMRQEAWWLSRLCTTREWLETAAMCIGVFPASG